FPYQLREPIPLSPQNLTRLAVALDPSRTRIGVLPGCASLKIAGLIHLGEQDAFHGTSLVQPHLSLRVLGPGILLVRYGNMLLFTYRRGKVAFHVGELAKLDEYGIGALLSFQPKP